MRKIRLTGFLFLYTRYTSLIIYLKTLMRKLFSKMQNSTYHLALSKQMNLNRTQNKPKQNINNKKCFKIKI